MSVLEDPAICQAAEQAPFVPFYAAPGAGVWLARPDLAGRPDPSATSARRELESRFGALNEIAWAQLAALPQPPPAGAYLATAPESARARDELRTRWGRRGDQAVRAGLLRALLAPGARVRTGEPMSRRTSMRVGGAAELWVEPSGEEDLRALVACLNAWDVPWIVVGAGSNLIIADTGIRGAAVRLSAPAFRRVGAGPAGVDAGAGAYLRQIVRAATAAGRAGLEAFEGIPGTVGGALRMNAGAMGREFLAAVERVRVLDRAGRVRECPGAAIDVGYRSCPFFKEHVALHVWLRTRPEATAEIARRVAAFAERRRGTQPAGASAGCVFRNPPGRSAGRLIDEAGLKGTRMGAAFVSPVHANFIVNEGGAHAADVMALIRHVQRRVRERTGVELEPEVILLGGDPAPGREGGEA